MPKRKGRSLNGILLLDKPRGPTSNNVLQQVKRLFNAAKAGHTGSLDPLATGMLPICFGDATKVSNFLLDADKRYIARCQLGIKTDSADADGVVIQQTANFNVSLDDIQPVLSEYTGEIEQIPPMHSAIKQDGVPLYKLAHKGQTVDRDSRKVTVHELNLVDFQQDTLEIDALCSKGTYIRALVEDIGDSLGCGAHVTALRRLQVGPFGSNLNGVDLSPSGSKMHRMYTLDELNAMKEQGVSALDQCLLPIEDALVHLPEVALSEEAARYISQGQAVFVPKINYTGYVRLFLPSNQFLGIGTVLDDGRIAPKRLMNMVNIG